MQHLWSEMKEFRDAVKKQDLPGVIDACSRIIIACERLLEEYKESRNAGIYLKGVIYAAARTKAIAGGGGPRLRMDSNFDFGVAHKQFESWEHQLKELCDHLRIEWAQFES